MLNAAVKQDPTDPELAGSMALTAARLGDPRAPRLAETARRLEERHQQRRALRRRHLLHPSDSNVTVQLARLELAAGHARAADDLANPVLRTAVDSPAALALRHH